MDSIYTVETVDEKERVLVVSQNDNVWLNDFISILEKKGADVSYSKQIDQNVERFDYVFLVIDQKSKKLKLDKTPGKNLIYILYNVTKHTTKNYTFHHKKIRTIAITGDLFKPHDLESMLWFSLSKNSNESQLKLNLVTKRENNSHGKLVKITKSWFSKKKLIFLLLIFIFIIHFVFIVPLTFSALFLYRSVIDLKNRSTQNAKNSLFSSTYALKFSKNFYFFSRPTFLFFSQALTFDNFIELDERAQILLTRLIALQENGQQIGKLVLDKNRSKDDSNILTVRFLKLKEDIAEVYKQIVYLRSNMPQQLTRIDKFNDILNQGYELATKLQSFTPYLESVLGSKTPKKYLVLFANNRELRPGGGFIGSFGILNFEKLTLENLKIYDVYDTDGQLEKHIEPPEPIKKYLSQPHWFLRDSAFSSDFRENYTTAKNFLENENMASNFDGAILITTTAIENILSATGELYIPDFDEKITSKNFYIKAQIYAEKNFFPGSTQKKTFLGAVTNQLFLNFDSDKSTSIFKLAEGIKKSFDEKQMIVYFEDPQIQKLFDSLYWSGRLIRPDCVEKDPCINDYFFPYDANLGVNKTNYYLNRTVQQRIRFESDGTIKHSVSIIYKNNSSVSSFPGGDYRNYFQVLLPENSFIKSVTKNEVAIEDFVIDSDSTFKKLGFYFEIPTLSQKEIKIEYTVPQKLSKGRNIYQFIIQKQIGSPNSDFTLDLSLAKNISLLSNNFSPLVKDNRILYNTNLSADKIFFVELTKE